MEQQHDETHTYFQTLFQAKQEAHWVLVWEKRGNDARGAKNSYWFTDLQEATAKSRALAQSGKSHVYAGVNLSPKNYGPKQRCKAAEIVAVTGLYADLDLLSGPESHKKAALPEDPRQALELLDVACGLFKTTLVVHSGFGLHPYWLFKEPYLIETPQEREFIASLVARWQAMIHAAGVRAGWNFDKTQDLSRVLRVPGTPNVKTSPAVLSTIHTIEPKQRFNPSEFDEFLEALPADVAPVVSAPSVEHQKRPVVEPQQNVIAFPSQLVRNPDASIAHPRMEEFFVLYPKAKAAYYDKAKKLKSWSERDLSLAWCAWDAGWSEQEVFDLIVMFRRDQSGGSHTEVAKKPFVHKTYFHRTITKVRQSNPRVETSDELPHQTAKGYPDSEEFALAHAAEFTDAAVAKSQKDKKGLMVALLTKLGCNAIKAFHRMGRENSVWEVELTNGLRATIGSTYELTRNSDRLGVVLYEQCEYVIPAFTRKSWSAVAQLIVDTCIPHDDVDMSDTGRVKQMLLEFLSEELTEPPEDSELTHLAAQAMAFTRLYDGDSRKLIDLVEQFCLYIPVARFETHVRARGFTSKQMGRLASHMRALGFRKYTFMYYPSGDDKGRSRSNRGYFLAAFDDLPDDVKNALPGQDI